MKVKKLLTLLALTTMLSACTLPGVDPTQPDDPNTPVQPGEETKYTVSFSANGGEGTMAAVADVKGEYTLPACTFTAPQGKEFAGWKVNGQGEVLAAGAKINVAADVQLVAQWNLVKALVSITLEGPTKVAYTAGEELSLEGLVVTAHYNDETTEVIPAAAYTTNADELDMKESGSKTVTVTYQGVVEHFTITVTAPSDWSAEVKENFAAKLHGVQVPFFYAYDLGLGDLTWDVEGDYVFADGDVELEPEAEGEPIEALEAVKAVFVAAEWTFSSEGSEEDYFEYVARKTIEVESKTYCVQAVFGAYDATGGEFAESGTFEIQLSDPYYYTWAETGLDATLKELFAYEGNIPVLPDGFYRKNIIARASYYYSRAGFVPVILDVVPSEAFLNALGQSAAAAGWKVGEGSLSGADYDYLAVSSDGKLQVEIMLSKTYVTFYFEKASSTIPSYVNTVAGILDILPNVFVNSQKYSYYYFESKKKDELGEGESFLKLVEALGAKLTGFVQHGQKVDEENGASASYFLISDDPDIESIRVDLTFASGYGLIIIRQYTPIEKKISDICGVLGVDPFDIKVDDKSGTLFLTLEGDQIDQDLTLEQIIGVYTQKLDDDKLLGDDAVVAMQPLNDKGIQSYGTSRYIDYVTDDADNNKLVEFWAGADEDGKYLQISFESYNPAPELSWLAAVEAALNLGEFIWDNSSKQFYLGGLMPEEPAYTYTQYVQLLGSAIIGANNQLQQLSAAAGSSYTEVKLYSSDAVVTIQAYDDGDYDDDDNWVSGDNRFAILIKLFAHPEFPPMVNAIIAATGADLEPVEGYDGYYAAITTTYAVNAGYTMTQVYSGTTTIGDLLGKSYSEAAALLRANGLKFAIVDAQTGYDATNHAYVVTLTNPAGWTVQVTLFGNADDKYTGYNQVLVIAPAPAGDGE